MSRHDRADAPEATRLRAVSFDGVGTLLRLREPVGQTYGRFAHRHGVTLPAGRIDEGFHRILASAPPMAFPGEPAERVCELERHWWWSRVRETFRATDQTARFTDFDAYFAEVFAHYATAEAWETMPGARETLAELRAMGLRTAVASNFDHRLGPILQALDLLDFFELLWTPGAAGSAKPASAFFQGLAEALGLPTDAILHVGDDGEDDGRGARDAGLRAWILEPPATLADLLAQVRADPTGT